jgi:hypothetical protein
MLTLTYTERSGLSFKKFVLFTGYEVDANVDLRYVISFNSNLVKSAVISFKTCFNFGLILTIVYDKMLTLTYTERSGLSFKKFVLFTGYEVDANEQI